MIHPKLLLPNGIEKFNIDSKIIEIPKCSVRLKKWEGTIQDTFGSKPIINHHNKPMFAEFVIVNLLKESGWDARWVGTYGSPKMSPIFLQEWNGNNISNQKNYPIENEKINQIIHTIALDNNKSYSGCWDIISWKDDQVLFIESKRSKKDKIRNSQIGWLQAVLKNQLSENNLMIFEWDFE